MNGQKDNKPQIEEKPINESNDKRGQVKQGRIDGRNSGNPP